MRKIIFISFLLIAILSLCAVTAAENASDIAQPQDANNTILADTYEVSGNTFGDIQNIINQAKDNSTIALNGTYIGEGKEITINKDLTIEGNGATLDGNNASRILNITSGNVVLKNINFINANSTLNGAAIFTAGKLTVTNCSFINNTVYASHYWPNPFSDNYYYPIGEAGAIYSTNDMTIAGSSFNNNTAWYYDRICDDYGHFIRNEYVQYSGAIVCKGKLHLEKSNFSKNSAPSITARYTYIDNCIFKNQEEPLYVDDHDTEAFILNSIFESCSAYSYNTELTSEYLSNIVWHVKNCSFTNGNGRIIRTSELGKIFIEDSVFENNTIDRYHGYMISLIEGGHVSIVNSTFINNTARDTAIIEAKSYAVNNSTFINNYEGVIYSVEYLFDGTGIYDDLDNREDPDYYRSEYILDETFNKTNVFKAQFKNKFSKTYYNSGKVIAIDWINIRTNEQFIYWGNCLVYVDNKPYYDYGIENSMTIPASKWKVGTHTIDIYYKDSYVTPSKLSFKVTIQKAATTVKAPKVTNKYKKTKYFKVTVKSNKKVVKNLKIKVKVYTGKKYKTYTIKTDKNGIAKLNTKKLKIGKHMVVLSSGNTNYKLSAKSQITIKK